MTQHASLEPARWAAFDLDQQILMIANEMNRSAKLMAPADRDRRLGSYARTLQLVDLTVATRTQHGLRRELLRWRDLVARLCASAEADPEAHAAALRCLLRFTPVAARQLGPLGLHSRPAGTATETPAA